MRLISVSKSAAAASVMLAAAALTHSPAAAENVTFISNQMTGEVRASNLVGVVVTNKAGDTVGDINDVVFASDGQVSVYIIGVGGVLGIGEKNVAVPFSAVTLSTDKDMKRTAVLDVTKDALETAPTYSSERTTFEKVEDGAAGLATAASQKAKELKDKMTAPAPATPPK